MPVVAVWCGVVLLSLRPAHGSRARPVKMALGKQLQAHAAWTSDLELQGPSDGCRLQG
jgi:hypothetical protein